MNDQSTWLTNHIHREEGTVDIAIELLISKKGTKLMLLTMATPDQGILILLQ